MNGLNLINENISKYQLFYKNNDLKAINVLNETILNELDKNGFVPLNKKDNLKQICLTYNLGNSKIGKDTICISVASGLNCPMNILGKCSNCRICYAMAQNRQYFKNTVPKNLINQILINQIVLDEITLHEVLFNTINNIYCNCSEKDIKNLKFLRFNVEGDILNNDILSVLDDIAYYLSIAFNLKAVYTYTHNKELNFESVKNICFNLSDFKNNSFKTVKTIFKINDDVRDKIVKKEIILCNGKCNNCSYCKDKNEKRTVLFLVHGGKYKGINEIKVNDSKLYNLICEYKANDYKKFIGCGLNE